MALVEVAADDGTGPDRLLALAASLEDASEHPVARAVADGARDRGLALSPPRRSGTSPAGASRPGRRARAAGRLGRAAGGAWLDRPRSGPGRGRRHAGGGRTAVVAGWDGRARGVLAVADRVKAGSRAAVERLRALGLETVLLTGDHQATARTVAGELGVDAVAAESCPTARWPRSAASGPARWWPWSATASTTPRPWPRPTSAWPSAAAPTWPSRPATSPWSAATRTASPTPSPSPPETYATIKQNLFWAFAYNVAAIPLAALGRLHPMVAAAAMSLSSVFVVTAPCSSAPSPRPTPRAVRARPRPGRGGRGRPGRRPRPVPPPDPAAARSPAGPPGRPHRLPGAPAATETRLGPGHLLRPLPTDHRVRPRRPRRRPRRPRRRRRPNDPGHLRRLGRHPPPSEPPWPRRATRSPGRPASCIPFRRSPSSPASSAGRRGAYATRPTPA